MHNAHHGPVGTAGGVTVGAAGAGAERHGRGRPAPHPAPAPLAPQWPPGGPAPAACRGAAAGRFRVPHAPRLPPSPSPPYSPPRPIPSPVLRLPLDAWVPPGVHHHHVGCSLPGGEGGREGGRGGAGRGGTRWAVQEACASMSGCKADPRQAGRQAGAHPFPPTPPPHREVQRHAPGLEAHQEHLRGCGRGSGEEGGRNGSHAATHARRRGFGGDLAGGWCVEGASRVCVTGGVQAPAGGRRQAGRHGALAGGTSQERTGAVDKVRMQQWGSGQAGGQEPRQQSG